MTCNSLTASVIESYLISLDCPRALTVLILFRNKEYRQIVELDIDPSVYIEPESFRHAYLATKFLSKATFLKTKINLKEVAIDKFLMAEAACGEINKRGYHHLFIKEQVTNELHSAIIRKIDSILGDFSFDELVDSAGWGPGVTTLVKGVDTSPANKFRFENGTTRPLYDLMNGLYASIYPLWDLSKQQIQLGNQVVTVPKNSKTDRTIAIEPGLNLWFQKAIGRMIRRRLFRVGIDLDDQSVNQELSRVSSLSGQLATVDFSAASDTISESTVRELIPNGWLLPMDIFRSRFGLLSKSFFRYEKFSSMGNGFTFELETLIFYSIAWAVCKKLQLSVKDISVYGDDVIIPVRAFDLFAKVSAFYGFTVNTQKSFSSGYFRESCGAHWFNGVNCKPYFLKEEIKTDLDRYKAANTIRRTALHDDGFFQHCDKRFLKVWRLIFNSASFKLTISDGFGDGGFIVNFDEACPSKAKRCIEGYFALSYVAVPVRYSSDDHAILLARLHGRSVEMSFGNKTNLRGRVKISRKRILIPRWRNLGPWF